MEDHGSWIQAPGPVAYCGAASLNYKHPCYFTRLWSLNAEATRRQRGTWSADCALHITTQCHTINVFFETEHAHFSRMRFLGQLVN